MVYLQSCGRNHRLCSQGQEFKMSGKETSYGTIFKTTFLFGFVQVFNIFVKVILNKVVALLLGAEGMGIIGIYNSAVNLLKTGAGLGISQSAVRDISEANSSGNEGKFSHIISVTNKVLFFTSLLGALATILLSPFLSEWYFNNKTYTIAFLWLSIVVAINIMSEGQLAILKGMRRLRELAKSSMYGALVGLVSAVPFYYCFKERGIVPSLIMTAFASLFFSNLYVRRIKYSRIKLKLKEVFKDARPMVKMGVALMLVSFIAALFDMIVAAFISRNGSLADVGYYNAGATIITGYFGIVITSMSTDYYPRISAVHNNNEQLANEMNRQSEAGLILMCPLAVLFIFLSPFFIDILYSKDFYATINYTDYAIIGTVIIVVSNCMGMILLAKQASNIYIFSVLGQRIILLGIYIIAYIKLGLMGLGLAYICTGFVHILFMTLILRHFYSIKLSNRVYKLLISVLVLTLISIIFRKINLAVLRYTAGCAVLIASCITSVIYMKKYMNINILNKINTKLHK